MDKSQISLIDNQLESYTQTCLEPCYKNTFPAISLSAAYLLDKEIDENEIVMFCPVDPYVKSEYFDALQDVIQEAEKRESNLT